MIYSLLLALVLLVPGSILTSASATTDLKVFVANDAVHELQVKATQTADGQIIPASNFIVTPESVIQIHQNENLLVFASTNEPQKIEKVQVTDASLVTTELVAPYSLTSLSVGVYTLNVIVNNGNEKIAYETLLIILAPNQAPVEKTEITKIIQKVNVDVRIDFDDKQKCRPGYYYDKKTNECVKVNICPSGFNHTDRGCTELPNPNPEPPANDTDPIPGPPVDPPTCTPGNGECPPCPEDTEASWCMDEDERQDTDDGLPEYVPPTDEEEEENTANCGGEPCTDDEKEDSWTDEEVEEVSEEESSDEENESLYG